jgi:hypothetical protein
MVAWAGLVAVLIAPIISIAGLFGLAAGLVAGGPLGVLFALFAAMKLGILPAMISLMAALFCYFRGYLSIAVPRPWIILGAATGTLSTVVVNAFDGDWGRDAVVLLLAVSSAFGGGIAGGIFWTILNGGLVWFARASVLILAPVVVSVAWFEVTQLNAVRCVNQQFWSSGEMMAEGIAFGFDAPVCVRQRPDELSVYFPPEILGPIDIRGDQNSQWSPKNGISARMIGQEVFQRVATEIAQPSDIFGPKQLLDSGVEFSPPSDAELEDFPWRRKVSKASYRDADLFVLVEIKTSGTEGEWINHVANVSVAVDDAYYFRLQHSFIRNELVQAVERAVGLAKRVAELTRESQVHTGSASTANNRNPTTAPRSHPTAWPARRYRRTGSIPGCRWGRSR